MEKLLMKRETIETSFEYIRNRKIKEIYTGRAYKGNMVLFVPLIRADVVQICMSDGLSCGTRQPERA